NATSHRKITASDSLSTAVVAGISAAAWLQAALAAATGPARLAPGAGARGRVAHFPGAAGAERLARLPPSRQPAPERGPTLYFLQRAVRCRATNARRRRREALRKVCTRSSCCHLRATCAYAYVYPSKVGESPTPLADARPVACL